MWVSFLFYRNTPFNLRAQKREISRRSILFIVDGCFELSVSLAQNDRYDHIIDTK